MEPAPLHRFDAPSCVQHGAGVRAQLPERVREFGGTRVLLVTDPGLVKMGVAGEAVAALERAGLAVAVFDGVQPDPTDANVAQGFEALRAQRADLVVALGGGSPIDVAKVVAIRAANPEPLPAFMGLHKIAHAGLPVIAMPTTAGTGSEVTKVAVITDTSNRIKMMMLSARLLPRAALVDYELSLGMPKPLTAAVGVDTLTHGIEAYVSRKANALTDPLALQCIELTARHLRQAWAEPSNREAREAMMLAATLGGLAFSNSSVALVHGMSRPLGTLLHLPHGLSNAVLLPAVTRYSIPAAPERYAAVARTVRCAAPETPAAAACASLVEWLEALNRTLEIPRLSECARQPWSRVEPELSKLAQDALASGSPAQNPRLPTTEEIESLYRQAW